MIIASYVMYKRKEEQSLHQILNIIYGVIITVAAHSLKVKFHRKRKVYSSLQVTKMQRVNQKSPGMQYR